MPLRASLKRSARPLAGTRATLESSMKWASDAFKAAR
jgi:hypothetical protein